MWEVIPLIPAKISSDVSLKPAAGLTETEN